MTAPGRLLFLVAIGAVAAGCKKDPPAPKADAEFYKTVQAQLIKAKPGEVIELPEGRFVLDRSLSSTVDNVTIRGKGMDKTVLSFKAQKQGAEGILLKGNNLTIEDLAVEDAKGDAIKVSGANGITIRRVRVEWTGGPKKENGAYGLYPVQCQNVLIEDSVAIGASDAGIYVGQSKHVIIRRNTARLNVAGIESENSEFVDIHDNVVTGNTGGILVFDLPDLPVQGGKAVRVFQNQVHGNNTDNFAPEGNIVGLVPTGTGVMVMANDNVEIFDNEIRDHRTVNVAVVSYFVTQKKVNDPKYDPWPEGVSIHDNRIANGGDSPSGLLVKVLAFKLGKLPDILWDGIVNKAKLVDGKVPDAARLCIRNNGEATFANIDAANDFDNVKRELAPHDCAHPSPSAVTFSQAGAE